MGDLESVVDWEELELRFDGDLEVLQEVARLFLVHADEQLRRLTEAVLSGSPEAVSSEAHRIKGSLAQVASESGRKLALALESAARAGDLEDASSLLEQIRQAISAIKTEFSAHIR
jgi:HPt (histidine-containing phosphotransfer) domain-containing protein